MRRRAQPEALVVAMVCLVALFASTVIRVPDNFFVDDSYFYLQVAWNIAHGAGSTFNGLIPTNGYHPLWMAILAFVFKVCPTKFAAIHVAAIAICVLDCVAVIFLAKLVDRTADSLLWPAFVLYVPFSFCTQLGTEGALSGCLLAGLMLATYRLAKEPGLMAGLVTALVGSLAVLARLDNIFIIGATFAGSLVYTYRNNLPLHRKVLVRGIPIYALLWGGYLWSNFHWFGTLQPISGLLKAHALGEVWRWNRITPIASGSFSIIFVCLAVLVRFRRDLMFYTVELPFALGVVCHAGYIYLVLSHETHWSWYYTSWVLLASFLLSRVGSLVLSGGLMGADVPGAEARPLPAQGPWLKPRPIRKHWNHGLAAVAMLALLVVWYRSSYVRRGHMEPENTGVGFEENVHDRLHLQRVLAFDLAGRMAFYSRAQIMTLDGLMGDLEFQKDLSQKGIQAVIAEHGIEAFAGPPEPLDALEKGRLCDHIFLSSMRFHCVAASGGGWNVDRVEVYARLTGGDAGSIALPEKALVWNDPDVNRIAVWRLAPAAEPAGAP